MTNNVVSSVQEGLFITTTCGSCFSMVDQVANYGVGGQYEPHFDFSRVSSVFGSKFVCMWKFLCSHLSLFLPFWTLFSLCVMSGSVCEYHVVFGSMHACYTCAGATEWLILMFIHIIQRSSIIHPRIKKYKIIESSYSAHSFSTFAFCALKHIIWSYYNSIRNKVQFDLYAVCVPLVAGS